jgi:outer membrane protein TolC
VREQAGELRDAIDSAVTAAHFEDVRARSAILAADRREKALARTLEARREQLRVGRITATDVVTTQTQLTLARLQRINAYIDVLAADIQIDYATGSLPRPGVTGSAATTTDR